MAVELQHCVLAHGDLADGRCAWCGGLLPPRRSRWCSDACSRAWAANHVWSIARRAALYRAGERCEVCGDPEDLEVHHDPPVGRRGYGQGCQHHQANLHVLCLLHHREAEAALRAQPGTVTQLRLVAA